MMRLWIAAALLCCGLLSGPQSSHPLEEAKDPTFAGFVNRFPLRTSPLTLPDDAASWRGAKIPKTMGERFICDVSGSDWHCLEQTGDKNMDYDTRGSYRAFGQFPLGDQHRALLYGLHFLGYSTLYLATYDGEGKLVQRVHVAGHDGDYHHRSCKVGSTSAFTVTDLEYGQKDIHPLEKLTVLRRWHYTWDATAHRWQEKSEVLTGDAAREAAK